MFDCSYWRPHWRRTYVTMYTWQNLSLLYLGCWNDKSKNKKQKKQKPLPVENAIINKPGVWFDARSWPDLYNHAWLRQQRIITINATPRKSDWLIGQVTYFNTYPILLRSITRKEVHSQITEKGPVKLRQTIAYGKLIQSGRLRCVVLTVYPRGSWNKMLILAENFNDVS